MAFSSKRVRPLFTLVFVVLGAFGGSKLASWYCGKFIDTLSGTEFFGFLKRGLSSTDENWLTVFFLVVGALVGFIFEFVTFQQLAASKAKLERMAPHDKLITICGIVLGLLLTVLVQTILTPPMWFNIVVALILCYTSVAALSSLQEQVRFYFPASMPAMKGDTKSASHPKILDTNVIIDGRIADIARAGFVEGPIYVPKFVLEELQQIADSSDSLKRARGRRGLDILNQMQKEMELTIPEFSVDTSDEEVDARLVRVAREVTGAIVTNDYNLNRVAELQGVDVMNINELANALKPVVLPGEEMRVLIIREGKEKEQGIGYLDDGTMIVVEGARRLIGEALLVCVTSVLQTVQGKMIFGKIKDDAEQETEQFEDSVRSYSGGRPRKKIR